MGFSSPPLRFVSYASSKPGESFKEANKYKHFRPVLEFQLKMLPFKGFGYAELLRVLTLVCEIGIGSWRSREEGKLDLLSFAPIEAA
jgi:hypothetical protein